MNLLAIKYGDVQCPLEMKTQWIQPINANCSVHYMQLIMSKGKSHTYSKR